jgi:hypothetical protein
MFTYGSSNIKLTLGLSAKHASHIIATALVNSTTRVLMTQAVAETISSHIEIFRRNRLVLCASFAFDQNIRRIKLQSPVKYDALSVIIS